MSEGLSSSPLSSPPESVVNVRLGSPVKDDKVSPVSSNQVESKVETVAESVVIAKQPTASPERKVEGEKSFAHDSDGSGQSSVQKRKASISKNPASTKKPRHAAPATRKSAQDKKWEAPFVFTDSKSPLAVADLRAILLHPLAWDILTPEEKQDVLAKFPDETHLLDAGTQDARPNPASLRNDDNFRYDCARYCENIQLGRHDEEWLSQAWVAHEKHKRGDYDQFLRERFEDEWETKLPAEHKTKDPESDEGLEQGVTETSEGPPLDAEGTTTPRPTRRSARSLQSTPKNDSPRGTRDTKIHSVDTKGSRAEATNGGSKTPQPINSSEISSNSPPVASQEQKASPSTVLARSD
ncbi:Asx homology domain-containing protein [Chaetomium tenue]|uniref:Asx homology domain-containing protein n=1 Tax=Chaetomium tenue TaxID=1854479 RepID=A0ACB7PIN5_9PEZI|nr:Asx homology domain-containing protein [Chaetomium globosum]